MKYILIILILSANGTAIQKVEFDSLVLCNLFKTSMIRLSKDVPENPVANIVVLGWKCFKTHHEEE